MGVGKCSVRQHGKLLRSVSFDASSGTGPEALGHRTRSVDPRRKGTHRTVPEKKLEDQILNLEKLNDECRQNILELEDNGAKDRRIDSLSEFIKMTAFDTRAKIPETVIDNFVDQIVYDYGCFIWYLNPTYGNELYRQETSDWEKTAAGIFQ